MPYPVSDYAVGISYRTPSRKLPSIYRPLEFLCWYYVKIPTVLSLSPSMISSWALKQYCIVYTTICAMSYIYIFVWKGRKWLLRITWDSQLDIPTRCLVEKRPISRRQKYVVIRAKTLAVVILTSQINANTTKFR